MFLAPGLVVLTRRKFLRLLAFLPWLLPAPALARRFLVDVRQGLDESRQRVVFEFSRKVKLVRHGSLKNPPRLYIDISDVRKAVAVDKLKFPQDGVVKKVRRHLDKNGKLRLVLDLRRLPGAKDRLRQWSSPDGVRDRIVIDFTMPAGFLPPAKKPAQSSPQRSAQAFQRAAAKRRVVMIDPGHGGKDPGAVGRKGTYEKDVVLKISRYLYGMLKADPGITPYMTRNRDIYLRLHERTRMARSKASNFFISVHADAARRRSARGASVYMLSTKGESSAEARWLANRENAADLVGGTKLVDQKQYVQDMMLDMSQGAVHEYSTRATRAMIGSLKPSVRMHNTRIGRAGFAVLKSPDIPSILVETGFISNAGEEKLLRTTAHQKKIAKALYKGIREYYRQNPEYS